MRVKFVVKIEDRALFHFGAASKGAPLPSTFHCIFEAGTARFSYAMR